jgi:putative heme-binding domain-containing protein
LLDQAGDPGTAGRVLAALTAVKTDHFRDRLNRFGAEESRPPLLRVAALEAASGRRGNVTDSSLGLLIGLLDGGPVESLQAAQMIGGAVLSKPQLIRLAPRLTSAGPGQLQELINAYPRSQDADVARAFLASMRDARSLTTLAPDRFSNVILHYPPELLPAANALLERIRREEEHKLARLDALLPLLDRGDAARGRALFFSDKAKCATCHRVGDQGGKIGPDLTTIGANRASRDVLESIVFPSATIVRDYAPYSVATADGRALSGLIVRETTDTVFLQQQTGDPVAIPRAEIEELAPSTVSLMPNGLEQALTEAELADVIAYLTSLKPTPVTQAPQRTDDR